MTYPKIGLALGGGAARGLAHIGVLQVLSEHRIPVSCVAGCSMGAVIAAVWATGSDLYRLEKLVYSLDEKEIFDVTVPRMGLLKGHKAESLIRMLTKNKNFDETKIPLAVNAADIMTGENLTLAEGNIARAVRASISMPGVFDPVEMGGRMLVDGGVIERVPMQALKTLSPELMIAVDVGYRGHERKKPSNIFEMLLLSFEINEWNMAKQELIEADVIITPDVYRLDMASLRDARECIRMGREAAEAQVENIFRAVEAYQRMTSGCV